MATRYWVIGWRPRGATPYFFRGDRRYAIYLPYVSAERMTPGWVHDIRYARVFEGYPCFGEKSYSSRLDMRYVQIYPYDGELLATQILRPIKRPSRNRDAK